MAYLFMSVLVFCIVSGTVTVAAYLPTPGASMNLFGFRYVSRSMGFALGWLYFYSLGILVPYEITAAGLVIDYWKSDINIAVWISIMIVVIVGLNLLPVKFYGETEFWYVEKDSWLLVATRVHELIITRFASTKVVMMTGLLILSVVLFFGGGPNHDRLGFRYVICNVVCRNTLLTCDKDTGKILEQQIPTWRQEIQADSWLCFRHLCSLPSHSRLLLSS